MNQELMKVVERAVRPVRADRRRKLRMRQELLSHLTALYVEERAKLGDDAAGFEEACRRFGDPSELSQELDRSVGFWGRWPWNEERLVEGFERAIGYREDRSFAWHLGRASFLSLGTGIFMACLVVLIAMAVPDRRLDWDQAKGLLPVLFYVVATTFILHGSSLLLVANFYDAERPRWARAFWHAAGCAVGMTAVFYLMYWAIQGDIRPLLWQLPIVAAVNASVPMGLIFAAWSSEKTARPHREWSRLQLDE
jgi:hypothetical protein